MKKIVIKLIVIVMSMLKTELKVVYFRLICNTRRRIYHALNANIKPSSSLGLLGLDIDTYRKWIDFK